MREKFLRKKYVRDFKCLKGQIMSKTLENKRKMQFWRFGDPHRQLERFALYL